MQRVNTCISTKTVIYDDMQYTTVIMDIPDNQWYKYLSRDNAYQ